MSVSNPALAAGGFPTLPGKPVSGTTAESLVLVALIFQGIVTLLAFAGLLYGIVYGAIHPSSAAWGAVAAGVILVAALGFLLYAGYSFSYRRTMAGDYRQAQTWTLLLGILTLFVGLIPGILYLIGYVKLGDAIREKEGFVSPGGPISPAQIACKSCGRVYPLGLYAFCPSCGQKIGA